MSRGLKALFQLVLSLIRQSQLLLYNQDKDQVRARIMRRTALSNKYLYCHCRDEKLPVLMYLKIAANL